MKEHFFIKGNTVDKITYYHLVIFAMTLPFDRLYSELALISLSIHTLIHLKKIDIKKGILKNWLLPGAIFLLTVLSTAYTHFYGEAFYEWERQLAFLLFPLIVLCNPFDYKKYLFNILFALALSCSLAILYLYYSAFLIIGHNHLPVGFVFSNAFINHNFSAPIDMHATYFSMYIALASVGMIDGFIRSQSSANKWLYGCMGLILFAGLVQLSSRAVLIAFAVIVCIVIPFLAFQKTKRKLFVMGAVIFSLVVFFGMTNLENFKTRFTIGLKDDLVQASINTNTLEPRITRWNCAFEMIKNSPLYGYGSGSEIALLKEMYFKKRMYNSYLNELNVHNQYLSMLIKTGIIGLLILLYVFFMGARLAIRKKDILFSGFLVITASVCFSENIMDANKGIFFFVFFYSLFYLGSKKDEPQAIQK